MRVIFTRHALSRLQQRGLDKAWVERTISEPEWQESDPDPSLLRRFRSIDEAQGRILRVVIRCEQGETCRVITAMFGRGAQPIQVRKLDDPDG